MNFARISIKRYMMLVNSEGNQTIQKLMTRKIASNFEVRYEIFSFIVFSFFSFKPTHNGWWLPKHSHTHIFIFSLYSFHCSSIISCLLMPFDHTNIRLPPPPFQCQKKEESQKMYMRKISTWTIKVKGNKLCNTHMCVNKSERG